VEVLPAEGNPPPASDELASSGPVCLTSEAPEAKEALATSEDIPADNDND
jgi:hypothetical protein